ncbi:MAG: hypothetical protein GX623_06030 [Clostridiales bacterium]|nr:hypothetical protein [Clostridiales bacterium]
MGVAVGAAVGAAGSTGSIGSTDSIGSTGTAGSMGATGSTGSIGSTGSTGSIGSTGAAGSKGAAGSAVWSGECQSVEVMTFMSVPGAPVSPGRGVKAGSSACREGVCGSGGGARTPEKASGVGWNTGGGVKVGSMVGAGVGVGADTVSRTVRSVLCQASPCLNPAVSGPSRGVSRMEVSVQTVLAGASTASWTPGISLSASSQMRTPSIARLAVKVNTVFTPVCTLSSGVSNLSSRAGSCRLTPTRPRAPSTTWWERPRAVPRMPLASFGIRK